MKIRQKTDKNKGIQAKRHNKIKVEIYKLTSFKFILPLFSKIYQFIPEFFFYVKEIVEQTGIYTDQVFEIQMTT